MFEYTGILFNLKWLSIILAQLCKDKSSGRFFNIAKNLNCCCIGLKVNNNVLL